MTPQPQELEVWPVHPMPPSSYLLSPQRDGSQAALPSGGLTMQDALVRVRTQGWSGTPTSENHGLTSKEISREACVQLPT